MRRNLFWALGLAIALAAGCSNSSSNGVAQDAGPNPVGCPATAPAGKTSCALTQGARCNYSCSNGGPSVATCDGGAWSISLLAVACTDQGRGDGCRKDQDCQGPSEYCATVEVGGIMYCGTPSDMLCSSDSECADAGSGGFVCEETTCPSGAFAGKACFPGCTDASCGPSEETGLVCGTRHRCEPKACAKPSDCPQNFDCTAQACRRRTCSADSECTGYCVNGQCRDALGKCEQPRA